MKYSIIIPTYNHASDLLKPCVEAIIKYSNLPDIELIIVANGCFDETKEYLQYLTSYFSRTDIGSFKSLYFDEPLGYSRANNYGLGIATCDKIVLLNNDAFLLEQAKNAWLDQLNHQFEINPKCGISCVLKTHSDPAGRDFAIFFCVMIHRKVFDKIGFLNEEYGKGGGEDTEFSIEAENAGFEVCPATTMRWSEKDLLHVGDFPIYHRGEGTVHDVSLVPDWNDVFFRNTLKIAKKYNPAWYQWKISNNAERAVFLKGDTVFPRETMRYTQASENLVGIRILEIGCSSGYGLQFLPDNIDYLGIDYDAEIIKVAREQNWKPNAKFIQADANTFEYEQYDTIIAFESIEHIPNGLALVEKLKNHCQKMIITVPYNENPGKFSPHHVCHNLTPDKFREFKNIGLIDLTGNIHGISSPSADELSMLLIWDKNNPEKISYKEALAFLKIQHAEIYNEVIETDCYHITTNNQMLNRNVLDIGANIGSFSLLAGYLGAKKVVAVEPVSASFQFIQNNIKTSGLTNITPLKNVVSNTSGDFCDISLNTNSGHNSRYNVGERFETVESVTLSELLTYFDGDEIFLKLDCEGAEYDILLNATPQEMARISQIALEIHMDLHPTYKGSDIIEGKLKEFGFVNVSADQVFQWNIDSNGNPCNYIPLPFKQQVWIRAA